MCYICTEKSACVCTHSVRKRNFSVRDCILDSSVICHLFGVNLIYEAYGTLPRHAEQILLLCFICLCQRTRCDLHLKPQLYCLRYNVTAFHKLKTCTRFYCTFKYKHKSNYLSSLVYGRSWFLAKTSVIGVSLLCDLTLTTFNTHPKLKETTHFISLFTLFTILT